jgi:Family of unknown function (DUF6275)
VQQARAKELVYNHVRERLALTQSDVKIDTDQVYIVWFSKTLESWKALLGTTLPDGMYYEVTHNGLKRETYIDVYQKVENVVVPDPVPTSDPGSPNDESLS